MAGEILSKGIALSYGEENTALLNMTDTPDLGGEVESVEVTNLADGTRRYIKGLKSLGEGLEFNFWYTKEQFTALNAIEEETKWEIAFPDGLKATFNGTCSVRMNAAAVGEPLSFTLTIQPSSEISFA